MQDEGTEQDRLMLELEELRQRAAALEAAEAERKRAEESLHEQRRFLEAVLDSIEAGIVACDANGVLTLFNRRARHLHADSSVSRGPRGLFREKRVVFCRSFQAR